MVYKELITELLDSIDNSNAFLLGKIYTFIKCWLS